MTIPTLKKTNANFGVDDIPKNTFEDRANACIIGAFVGDACGAFLEFEKKIVSEERMKKCMEMNGGGPFSLYAG